MSDRPENQIEFRGGWHEPRAGTMWQAGAESRKPVIRVQALPTDLSEQPVERGAWHLPSSSDTPFTTGEEIEVADKSDMNETVPPFVAAPRPEDLLADIVRQSRAVSYPRPEDSVPRFERSTKSDEGDAMAALEALGAMDDDDDFEAEEESLSIGELMALQSLADAEGSTLPLDDDFDTQDFSPAQRAALFGMASEAADQLEQQTGAQATIQFTDDELAGDTVAEDDPNDPAAYARRMAEQYSSGTSDTDFPQQTQQFQTQEQSQQQQQPQYSQEEIQLAQQFRETRRQAQMLRQQYERGEIDDQTLQAQLQQHQLFVDGVWWMIGTESDTWYAYNQMTGQWDESQPPVPLDAGSPRTETGQFDPAEVQLDSLPYLPTEQQPQEYSDYDATQYNTAQEQYGGQFGMDDTPLPNPNQPPIDPDRTVVGDAFDANTLPYAADTVQNMDAVQGQQQYDEQYTVPSASQFDNYQQDPAYDQYQQDQYQGIESAYDDQQADYNRQVESQAYKDLQTAERGNLGRIIAFSLFGIVALGLIGVIGFFLAAMNWYNGAIEPYSAAIDALDSRQAEFQNAQILDANGELIVEILSGEGAREQVDITQDEVSPYLVHAIVSSEDPTFYENPGFNLGSILRAYIQNLQAGEVVSGASTITQQIARNIIIQDTTPSAERKAQEIVVALRISEQYTKNEILNIYLNEFFFGNQSYGVQAAAEFYFGKDAAALDLAESAMLAGILPSPVATNPVRNQVAAFSNMRVVLERMWEAGCLDFQHGPWANEGATFCIDANARTESGEQLISYDPNANEGERFGRSVALQMAFVEGRDYEPRASDLKYPHFVNAVTEQIESVYGPGALTQRGLVVRTTLFPRIQEEAETALRQRVADLSLNGVNTGSVIVLDPNTGAVRALVGSPDFTNEDLAGQVDNTRTYHQPGSAIKPILFTAALEPDGNQYLTPVSILWDVPSSYDVGGTPYNPTNINGQYQGPVTVREALQQSLNVPAVKAYIEVGEQDFRETAQSLGINFLPESSFGLPSALGANDVRLVDLAHAYATLAADGVYHPIVLIESITDSDGNDVPLPEAQQPYQAVNPQVAYLMQNILSDNSARGNAFGNATQYLSGQRLGLPPANYLAVKTGTSNEARDMMTVGFTNNWTVGVWLGTVNNSPTTGDLTASLAAAPVFERVMASAIAGTQVNEFARPTGIIQNTVCFLTGTLATADSTCPERGTEIYIDSFPPPNEGQGYARELTIDSWTGWLATDACPENNLTRTYADLSDPFALQYLNGTGRGILQQLGLPVPLEAPPSTQCSQGMLLPTVRLISPTANQVLMETVNITGQISIPADGNIPGLDRWQVEIAPTGTDNYSIISEVRTDQIPNAGGTLATWNSREVNNGTYTLRLSVFSQNGGFIYRERTVTINNTPPTATPTPQPSPTPFVPATIEPLPFDTPSVQGGGSGATPTVGDF